MSYTQAITEFRQLIADTSSHKRSTRKRLLGPIDGENTSFRTYDKRILEDTLQIFVNNIETTSFSLEDAISGEITVTPAPEKNQKIEASYYWQWFIDDEIKNFLNKGAESTGEFTSNVPDDAYLSIQPGLKNAALYFAASHAVRSLIQYMINRKHSGEFLVEQDSNDDNNFSATIQAMSKEADSYWDKACWYRDDFYKRLGKRNAPAFAIKVGSSRRYGPNR